MLSNFLNRKRIKYLNKLERWSSEKLGKGWGTETIAEEIEQIKHFLDPESVNVCIDIGGNKGLYTDALLRAFPNSRVITFEPAQANLDILTAKFADNHRVQLIPKGVGSETKTVKLFADTPGSGLGSLTRRNLNHFNLNFEHEETIDVVNFQSFWQDEIQKQDIDLCKLDIEGHELDALMGMGPAINHIKVIQFEFGGCNIDTKTFFQQFWYFFLEHGFSIYRISPFGPIKITKYSERDEFFATTNFIAVNNKASLL